MSPTPDTSSLSLPRFDIRISPPDLSAWRAGNCGIPGVWSFTADRAGPHLTLVSLIHGNEFAGAIALKRLLCAGIRPARGRLTLVFANLQAFDCFNPDTPTTSRFIDEDMNRIWDRHLLDGNSRSAEIVRARILRPVIEQADILLDLHTMLVDSAPLILCGSNSKGRMLAQDLSTPYLTVTDNGHASGRRLIDYPLFLSPDNDRTAILLEAGQHWVPEATDISADLITRIGTQTGVLPAVTPQPSMPARIAEVTHTITAASHTFRFVQPWRGLDCIAQCNTLIALDGNVEIRTPYDRCILVMPALRPSRGHTAIRLARMLS